MKGRFWLLLLFLIPVAVCRLVLAANSELSPEEAYYYEWSRHPDICYYSKGPLVAWSILATTTLFGSSEIGVRLLSPLLAFGTSLLIFFLGRRLYRERVGFWAVVALNLVPIFNLGSILMTIDSLSIFLWTAALTSFWLAQEEYNEGWFWWVVTGLLIGLGVLAKYTNAFALLSILILLIFSSRLRREFIRLRFYLLLLAFLPFLILPVWWNQQHDWIALDHLSLSGGLSRGWEISFVPLFQGIGGLFVLYSPLLLAGAFAALFASIPKARRNSKVNFLLAFTWPLLLAYVILSFKQHSDPSWTAPAFISLALLTAAWWLNLARARRWVLVAGPIACGVSALFTFMALNTDLWRQIGWSWSYQLDPSARARGWCSIATELNDFRNRFERRLGEDVFLIANRYQTAAVLGYYLPARQPDGPGHPPVYIPESQDIENQYSLWPRYDEFSDPDDTSNASSLFTEQAGVNRFVNRTALYITDRDENEPPSNIRNAFTRWELVALYAEQRRQLPLRQIKVFACYQYQTLPL
jgi:hypothetical protein